MGATLADYKIECGFDNGTLLIADVIDSGSGRLRFGDRDMSKAALPRRHAAAARDQEALRRGRRADRVPPLTGRQVHFS